MKYSSEIRADEENDRSLYVYSLCTFIDFDSLATLKNFCYF